MQTLDACEQAILAVLRNAGLSASVLDSTPTKDEDYTGDIVYLGATTTGESDWASLGALRRQETYTVAIGVLSEQWGDDPAAAKTTVRGLWASVVDALVADLRSQPSQIRTAGVLQFDRMTFT